MKKILLFMVMVVGLSAAAIAQLKPISGKVTDKDGKPIEGASVKVKGRSEGIATDADGSFKINVKAGDVLLISSIGHAAKQIKVSSQTMLSVILENADATMNEVVVTAIGQSQSKIKLGYATTTFSTATINKNGVSGALDGLEGKIAGADISNTGGPGSSTKVILRGYGIISGGSNQPLYVIDGVPLTDGQFQNAANDGSASHLNGVTDGIDFGNGMNNVNPNDIESITVLKGTAAASLYGGLAKNGAIMITTKKGKAGKIKIEYSGSANFSKVGKLPDYQNEFGQGWGGIFVSDENGSWGPKLDGKQRLWGSIVDNSQLEKPFSPIKNNLRNFFQTGSEYNNSLSLSGGNEATKFYFSYGNIASNGIVPNDANYQVRNNFSLRTNSTFDKFTINTSFNYVNQRLDVPSTGQASASGGGVYQSLLEIPVDLPITDFKDYKNKFFNINNYFTPYAENPYFALYENGNRQNLDRFFGNLDLGYKFTPHFNTEFRLGADFANARTFIWKQPAAAADGTWNGKFATNPEGFPRTADIGEVGQGSDYAATINADLIFKYNTQLNKDFSLDALVGGNFYKTSSKGEFTSVTNLVIPGFFNLSNTSKPPVTSDGSAEKLRLGVYGQVSIGFKDQLFLTGNLRNDWSSSLPIAKNAIFYPGANLSWVASKLFDSRTVSFLKFRTAYGRTGTDAPAYDVNNILTSGLIGLPLGSLTFPFNGTSGFGVSNTIGNPKLTPIFTDEFEFGTEAKFFKDRIGLDVTLYDKETKGQILAVSIAPSTGYGALIENLGLISNKGIELSLNLIPIEFKNFTWNLTYIFSRDWNKVENLNGATSQNPLVGPNVASDVELRAVVGKTVASIYTIVPQKTPSGQIVVNPVSGQSLPNQTHLDKFGMVKGYMGSGLYDYTMGLTNTFTYKDFSLNFSLDYRYGGVMYSNTADLSLFVGNSIATTYNDRKPFIIPNSVVASTDANGKTSYTPNKTYIGTPSITPGGTLNESDRTYNYYGEGSSFSGGADLMRIIDRSFLKLRDINLSYNLPVKWTSKIKAGGATVGVYGRNFLLWTPQSNVFVDPEATNLGNDLKGLLGEYSSTPLTKSYGIILKVNF